MRTAVDYDQSEHTAYVGRQEITVRSLTPRMTKEQRSETKEKIQGVLYSVFCKYMA